MEKNEIKICLWFDTQAEEAVNFYTSVFKDSAIGKISRFGNEGFEYHHKPEGSIMSIDFRLNKMNFTALNGGPEFRFNEAISIVVYCDTQDEIDYYWSRLTEGGEEVQCGWLKDRFGLSWQIVPSFMPDYMTDEDKSRKSRVESAMFRMKKLEIEELTNAYNGLQLSSLK
jgi:predicted 3-demethylubiquinone-9 3-methyltransferase (glyoxalase superfamily)